MKSLLKYFNKVKKECVMGPLFKLLEASFELIIPIVISDLIDKGITGGAGRNYISTRVLIMVLLGVIGLSCSVTAQYFSAKAATNFSARVRSALFKHIQTFSYAQIDTIGTSTMITRMTADVNQLQSGVNMTLRLFLRSPFIVIGAMVMAFSIDKKCSLIFLVVIILLSIVVYGVMIITMPKQRKVQESVDSILEKTRDNLSGVRVLRAFRKEKSEINAFRENNETLVDRQIVTEKIGALTNPITYVIVNLGLIVLIYAGAVKVNIGELSQGQVVALTNYMSQILVELIKLANFIVLDIKALASAKRIEQVLNMNEQMVEGSLELDCDKAPEIVFEDVIFSYNNASDKALEGISFTAKSGETVGIIGGTGSGKTTIINLIGRYYDVSGGRVMINGRNVKEYCIESLRKNVAMTPQKAVLFSGSIRDNMKWANENADDFAINEALNNAMAGDFVNEKEGGLDYMVNAGGKNLSGGQRQRLTVARALLKKTGILVLDDSSSALDAITDKKLRENIMKLKEHPTLFIVSQRTAAVMNADKIIVLDDGKMVGIGKHEELIKSCSVYKEIYDSQVKTEDNAKA